MKKALFGALLSGSLLAAPAISWSNRQDMIATPNGKAVSCLPLHRIRETHVRSDTVIDFRTSGNQWYRNTLPHSCPSLGFEERFMYETSLSELCSVDIITVLHSFGSGIDRGASCGLGQFQPVTLSKANAKPK